MPFGKPLAVRTQNCGEMRKFRHRPAQRLVERDLFRSIGKMIVAADHVRDLHQCVVNHHHVVVNRHPA